MSDKYDAFSTDDRDWLDNDAPAAERTERFQRSSGVDIPGRVGEVIESSTTELIAQSYTLHAAPPFGTLIRANDGESDVIGVVSSIRTAGIDPGRRPIARGFDEQTEEDVYRNNPELGAVLRTEFTALIVGYRDRDGVYYQHYSKQPPRLHAFVYTLASDEVLAFTQKLEFLNALLGASANDTSDQLLAACLREASLDWPESRAFLVGAGRRMAALLPADAGRLSRILDRMRQ